MGHGNYEDAKKLVWKGCLVLAVVTLIEVLFSLFGKGHLGFDPANRIAFGLPIPFSDDTLHVDLLLAIVGLVLIALSAYKAYYIIYNFMHMAHEVPGLRVSVLLPTVLLIWGMIAFFQEGGSWKKRKDVIENIDKIEAEKAIKPQGAIFKELPKLM